MPIDDAEFTSIASCTFSNPDLSDEAHSLLAVSKKDELYMSRVKAIIFDWDDTIVSSFDHLVLFHQEVARQLGWPPITNEQIKAVWGKPFEELIQALWPTHDSKDFDMAYRQHILNETLPEIEGAVTAIAKLKSSFLFGVLTAAPRFEVEHFMNHLGLNKGDFFAIQAAGESQYHKPDPRVFGPLISWLQERNISKSEILYVGDSLSDFQAARHAGLQIIGVVTGSTSREQFQIAGLRAEKILGSIAELPESLGVNPPNI
jgi:phosphoglycolate phosphatase